MSLLGVSCSLWGTWPYGPLPILIALIGYIFAFGLTTLVAFQNTVTELDNRIAQSQANLDTEIQRKTDLIQNLQKINQAAQGHEEKTLAQLRQQATSIRKEAHPNLTTEELAKPCSENRPTPKTVSNSAKTTRSISKRPKTTSPRPGQESSY